MSYQIHDLTGIVLMRLCSMHNQGITHQVPPCLFLVVFRLKLVDLHEALEPAEQL